MITPKENMSIIIVVRIEGITVPHCPPKMGMGVLNENDLNQHDYIRFQNVLKIFLLGEFSLEWVLLERVFPGE
jgi:hypothetical protein